MVQKLILYSLKLFNEFKLLLCKYDISEMLIIIKDWIDKMEYKNKQWTLSVDEANGEYSISNIDPDTGKKRFYEIVAGEYGQPIIIPEPELSWDIPLEMAENIVNLSGEKINSLELEKISGIICFGGPRFSLSAAKAKNMKVEFIGGRSGKILIDQVEWYVAYIFSKDKNRIRNYDVFTYKQPRKSIMLFELQDMSDILSRLIS